MVAEQIEIGIEVEKKRRNEEISGNTLYIY